MNVLTRKLKEVSFAVLPITVIVLILNFTAARLEAVDIIRFMVGTVSVIFGLTIFLFGVDLGISPVGSLMGSMLVKANRMWVITAAGFALAFIVSVAEPDLHILARQVDGVTAGLVSKDAIVVVVSLGVGALVSFGLFRIIKRVALNVTLTVLYGIILLLSFFTPREFIGIAFDASGATTGALTVPFLLALAIGVSARRKDSRASETDSFGLVAIASVGAIIAVMLTSAISGRMEINAGLEITSGAPQTIFGPFLSKLPVLALESLLAISPLAAMFVVFQLVSFRLRGRKLARILAGFLYTYAGLVLFLTGVNAGFMDVGRLIGYKVAMLENRSILVFVGFALGFVTILAEPAVYVLTENIEKVTSGYIKRKAVLAALSLGIGAALALTSVRIIVPGLQLWHYLLPGYLLSVTLSFFAPPLFVGIAFDAGGVASGPMTATFILAFTQGAAQAVDTANVLTDGFGMIAMVALFPLIALQLLGIIYKVKSGKRGLKQGG